MTTDLGSGVDDTRPMNAPEVRNPIISSEHRPAEYSGLRSFPGRLDQVREVRTFVAGIVQTSPVADDVVLSVSELSANAVLHTASGNPGGRFTVRVEVFAPHYTWIGVGDQGGEWKLPPSADLPEHGLSIVRHLAGKWSVDGNVNGWVVSAWFDWPDDCNSDPPELVSRWT